MYACNGILFNHESPRRGENFVTRKITLAIANIIAGRQDKLSLGNMNAKRDWGFAGDYVKGMWLMLQQDRADDYVLATNETHTVREFVEAAFAELGIEIRWEGSGVNEKGYDAVSGRLLVDVNPEFYRPAEVEFLWGDCAKAEKELGWKRQKKGAVRFMKLLSVIVPCYNEEENIRDFYDELFRNTSFFEEKEIEVEVIYVDDGSTDKTVQEIRKLHGEDARVHLLSFSRNFGKEAAIYAGLQKSRGDLVVMMDADLQDPPSLLPEMCGYIEQGYDSVATRRVTRKGEPPVRSFFARMFYRLMNKISKTEIVDGARDYRLMTRQVVDAILAMTEYNRFTKGIFGWVGYETKWLEYENIERKKGETKWSFWKLFVYSLEGITAFSTVPLTIAAVLGALFCVLAFGMIVFTIVRTLIFGDPTSGWPSLVCIIMMVSGVQLFCLGIVGQYLSKTYMEVKNRPIYLVKEDF